MRALFSILVVSTALVSSAASAQQIDWGMDGAFARKASVSSDVHRYAFPRTDLSVTLDGVAIKPGLALGGWVALKPAHDGAMAMGDLVLLESDRSGDK